MTEPKGGGAAGTDAAPAPRIVFLFPPDKPTDPTIQVDRVTRGQVYLAAYLLDLLAHEIRAQDLMAAAMGGQALGGTSPDELARIATEILGGRH